MARCKPFDEQIREALRRLEFTIADDGESAKFTDETSEGRGFSFEIYQPAVLANEGIFWLTIDLPSGMELDCTIWRDKLLNAAGIEEDEVA